MLSFLKKKTGKIVTETHDLPADRIVTIRADFPILCASENATLIYLDNACMSLRPRVVIDAVSKYYTDFSSCAGRSNHGLSRKLDIALHEARSDVARFIGARADQIVFTRNATESLNLIAHALSFETGDIVLTSDKEHNSNLVPWLEAVKRRGIVHRIVPPGSDGQFSTDNLQQELENAKKNGERVRLVSVSHVSNIDGTSVDVAQVAVRAHWYGALVAVDGCQAVGHTPVDVEALGVDFYAFSAHKMFGPSGMGALYVSKKAAGELGSFLTGGSTVVRTTYTSAVMQEGPARFEAGLQDYAGILGFGAACKYVQKIGVKNIAEHTHRLNMLLTELLQDELDSGKIQLLGPKDPASRGSIFSFIVPVMPQTEFASLLDKTFNIAVRAGQHCVHSWFHANNLEGSVRISLHVYNTEDEIRKAAQSIRALLRLHGG